MLIGSVFSVIVITILALVYYFSTSRLGQANATMALAGDLLYEQGMADMMHDAIKADVLHVLMLKQQGANTQEMQGEFAEHTETLRKSLDSIQRQADDQRIIKDLKVAYPDAMKYIQHAQGIMQDPQSSFESQKLGGFFEGYLRLEETMGKLGETMDKVIASHKEESDATVTAVNVGFGLTLFIGLVGIGVVFVSTRSVNRRLQELLESVKNIGEDETDLTRRVNVGQKEDEVGIAAKALNRYLDTMTSLFESFRQASTRLHAAVGNMSYLATQTQQHMVEAGTSIDHAVTAVAAVAH